MTASVVRVGDGRGFIVEGRHGRRLVITAAHCLPWFPPCHPASYTHERTYENLLGPLGGEAAVWAECIFADPIADIAVLSGPDDQVLFDQSDAYEALTDGPTPFAVVDLPYTDIEMREVAISLLSHEGAWFETTARYMRGPLCIAEGAKVDFGMSGSPILNSDGQAIGVISVDQIRALAFIYRQGYSAS